MAFLSIEAHDLTEEFEALILRDYGVTVRDKTGEPWCVVFEGERDKLRAMYDEHWGEPCGYDPLESDSPWLSEEYKS